MTYSRDTEPSGRKGGKDSQSRSIAFGLGLPIAFFRDRGPVPPRWRRILAYLSTAAAVLIVLILVLVLWAARALPGIVAAQIGRLTNAYVETGAFDFHLDGSVSIDGLVMRPHRQEAPYDDTILRAKTVYARFRRGSLLKLSPQVTEVRVTDFLLDVQLNLDTGRWNVGSLRLDLPRGNGSGVLPAINLQAGRLRYCKVSGDDAEVVTSVPLEACFGWSGESRRGYRLEVKTSQLSAGHGESHLAGYWRPGELTLAGGLSSTDIPSLARVWAVNVLAVGLKYDEKGDYTLDLRMKNVHGKQAPQVDALRFIVPAAGDRSGPLDTLGRFFARYQPTGRVGSIDIKATGNLGKLRESGLTGKLVCTDVSINDCKFPYAIDHLTGELDFTETLVITTGLSGKHGAVDLRIEGWTKGYGKERQYQYRVTSDNLVLDEALYAALRPEQKRLWDAFQPSGVIAADYRLVRTSPADKRIYVWAQLKAVTAAYREFPYPLTGLTGELYFDQESITASDLLSQAGAGQIRLSGKVTGRAAGKPIYYIFIDANDIPLDATLGAALPPRQRDLYRRFEMAGAADIRAKVFSTGDANGLGAVSFLADISCDEGSLRLGQVPVVLSNVRAEAAITPEALSIRRLDGRYEGGAVTMAGGMRFDKDGALRQYHVRATADEVPVNDQTLGLLPPSTMRQVAVFRPEGNVKLTVELKKTDGNEPPDEVVVVECLGNKISHERFAYPLHDIRGTIAVRNDSVTLQNVTAKPEFAGSSEAQAASGVQVNGTMKLANGGFERGSFTVKADEVWLTKELGDALPRDLASVYHDLSPEGPFDLDLPILRISRTAEDDKLVEFAGKADFRTCHLDVLGAAMELCGTLKAGCSYRTRHGFLQGRTQLAAERLAVKGKTVENLSIDAVYDPNTQKWSAENFLGDCHGGKVLGCLEVGKSQDDRLQYWLRAALDQVDLQRFLLDGRTGAAGAKNYSSGVMNASLSLGARVGEDRSKVGICQVHIADMRVGKVSPLAKLLSVLSLSEPTDYTFERLVIDSYLRQDTLLIQRFDMSGRNVAFAGSGTMDLPTDEVDLVLTARGTRVGAAGPSMLQSLTEGLGGAVVRMEVTGRTHDPHVETKALPLLEDSLKVLGAPQ